MVILSSHNISQLTEYISQEIKKKAAKRSMKELEKEEMEKFKKATEGKSIRRITKLMRKIDGSDRVVDKWKKGLNSKYEEFKKYVQGEDGVYVK